MENPVGGVTVPLSTFGGLSTELSPADLPEGGSPDNQDMAFMPGQAMTRPGLARVYPASWTTAPIVFQQQFTRKDGSQVNVQMDATGAVAVENFTDNPGVYTQIAQVPAGSRCKARGVYGKLWMAFNDGLRGSYVPLWTDGVGIGRVSQEGPAKAPVVQDYSTVENISSIGPVSPVGISNIKQNAQPIMAKVALYGSNQPERSYTLEIVGYFADGTNTAPSESVTVHNDGFNLSWSAVPGISYYKVFATFVDNGGHASNGITGTGALEGVGDHNNGVGPELHTTNINIDFDHYKWAGDGTSAPVSDTSNGNLVTVTTSTPHGLVVGQNVLVAVAYSSKYNGWYQVQSVISATQFTYAGNDSGLASATTGFVAEVFQVTTTAPHQLNAQDIFTVDGTVIYDTPGIYNLVNPNYWRVADVISDTQLYFIPLGLSADAVNALCTTSAGLVTTGAISSGGRSSQGQYRCAQFFITDQGYITRPSPPFVFTSAGNKRFAVSELAIGPSNVVARGLGFTSAEGSKYFTILKPIQLPNPNAQPGESATIDIQSLVVQDNVSTAMIVDFSDEALMGATGIDIDGNNLFDLKVLGNCATVFDYADRMWWTGDENRAINLLNMSFDASSTDLDGWTVIGSGVYLEANGVMGTGVKFSAGNNAVLKQGCCRDAYGNEILEGNTQYTFKCWASGTGTVTASIMDGGILLAGATLTVPAVAGFISGKFSAKTPVVIPETAELRISCSTTANVHVDEMGIIYSENPYNDTEWFGSYVQNPMSVDGVSGVLGSEEDPSPIMDAGKVRGNMVWVTHDDSDDRGRLHSTQKLDTEPATWDVTQVSDKCGACSLMTGISGQGWFSWANRDGGFLYDGSTPNKITQDIQSLWDSTDSAALKFIWSLHDVDNRRIYWGVKRSSVPLVIMLDYRYGETGAQIEERPSVRVSPYNGKMLVLELSRKFSPWTVQATCGGILATSQGIVPCFADGNGRTYRLEPNQFHDDDYGTIPWYYVTSAFASDDIEQAFKLGNGRHLYNYLTWFASGVGKVRITPLADSLSNAWPVRGPYLLSSDPKVDAEIPLNVAARKMLVKFSGIPVAGSVDSAFGLSRMTVTMQPHPFSAYTGIAR